jgi:hypothetical protein
MMSPLLSIEDSTPKVYFLRVYSIFLGIRSWKCDANDVMGPECGAQGTNAKCKTPQTIQARFGTHLQDSTSALQGPHWQSEKLETPFPEAQGPGGSLGVGPDTIRLADLWSTLQWPFCTIRAFLPTQTATRFSGLGGQKGTDTVPVARTGVHVECRGREISRGGFTRASVYRVCIVRFLRWVSVYLFEVVPWDMDLSTLPFLVSRIHASAHLLVHLVLLPEGRLDTITR